MQKSNRKLYLWLPYLDQINIKPKTVYFKYKGGELELEWIKIHSIMLYGEAVDLPQVFLEKCAFYKIPIVIHRRNLSQGVIITSNLTADKENILTKQIQFRENEKKRSYITKKLLQAKFKSMAWLIGNNNCDLLYKVIHIEKMLAIESWHAKRYWQEYFLKLGIEGTRRKDNPVKKTLDAVSKFIAGIILRWILYHNLSPYHGFLHKPTDYPALVYDLMEPYRGYFDKVVFDTIKDLKEKNQYEEKKILSFSIENLKNFLDTKVYVEATRQIVTFQELIHGVVLALRSYLLGETKRFIVPLPSKPNGGRPIKAGYKLYGHTAGITNFWPQTKEIAQNFERVYLLSTT